MRSIREEKQRLEGEAREWRRKEDSLTRELPELDRVIRDRNFEIRHKENKLREEDASIGTEEYERANEVRHRKTGSLVTCFGLMQDIMCRRRTKRSNNCVLSLST